MTSDIKQKLRDAIKNPNLVVLTNCGFGDNVIIDEKRLDYVLSHGDYTLVLYDNKRYFSIRELNPYKDLHEFTKSQNEHSKYICFKDYPDGLKLPIEINNHGIYVKWFDGMQFVSYKDLSERCTWQDGWPCGIIGREIEVLY